MMVLAKQNCPTFPIPHVNFHSNTYRFIQKHTTQKVVEDFADLLVVHDVFLVGLYQLVLAVGQIGEHLIIKVHLAEVHRFLLFFVEHYP